MQDTGREVYGQALVALPEDGHRGLVSIAGPPRAQGDVALLCNETQVPHRRFRTSAVLGMSKAWHHPSWWPAQSANAALSAWFFP